MVDLTTSYAGLQLKNPLVPSSSPLTGNLDDAKRLEEAGASALILPSSGLAAKAVAAALMPSAAHTARGMIRFMSKLPVD